MSKTESTLTASEQLFYDLIPVFQAHGLVPQTWPRRHHRGHVATLETVPAGSSGYIPVYSYRKERSLSVTWTRDNQQREVTLDAVLRGTTHHEGMSEAALDWYVIELVIRPSSKFGKAIPAMALYGPKTIAWFVDTLAANAGMESPIPVWMRNDSV